ncbi:uncharacterized protein LOC114282455 [Camellia sinensis]|uniref:uncharacterized protein LOC114282455 n=1 Tax=Camellia sinensis TaxID=4442 RepID=UPI001035EB36|nr:uncharacterized protein LOC114282455 [Camellia sinensis]
MADDLSHDEAPLEISSQLSPPAEMEADYRWEYAPSIRWHTIPKHMYYHLGEDSHSIRGYGATTTRDWYLDLAAGVWLYDWGGAGLAILYSYMTSTSCRRGNKVGGRAAGVLIAGGNRATRARTRGTPPAGQATGSPETPTMLTCWRSIGMAYQIPIEPAEARHRYVRGRDVPSAPPEYIKELLELLASFEGMILKREALLSLHGIQVQVIPRAPATATAPAPSPRPSIAKGKERWAPARSREERHDRG